MAMVLEWHVWRSHMAAVLRLSIYLYTVVNMLFPDTGKNIFSVSSKAPCFVSYPRGACTSIWIWVMTKHVITTVQCLGRHHALVFKLIPHISSARHSREELQPAGDLSWCFSNNTPDFLLRRTCKNKLPPRCPSDCETSNNESLLRGPPGNKCSSFTSTTVN